MKKSGEKKQRLQQHQLRKVSYYTVSYVCRLWCRLFGTRVPNGFLFPPSRVSESAAAARVYVYVVPCCERVLRIYYKPFYSSLGIYYLLVVDIPLNPETPGCYDHRIRTCIISVANAVIIIWFAHFHHYYCCEVSVRGLGMTHAARL